MIEGLHTRHVGPVSLHIAAGECVGLSGASGSGKTLLLRAVADLDPHTGRVCLDGVDSRELPGPQWRRQVGLLAADSPWWAPRVGDHFREADEALLEILGFDRSVMGWTVERLSTGERQRLALARLLQNQPPVLLLDEPSANLDPTAVAQVEKLLADYRRRNNAAVLWVSHSREQIARVAARQLLLAEGRVEEVLPCN